MITLDLTGRAPIYEQICSQFSSLISKGVLKENDKLPSSRMLAKELGLNPNTVAKAYSRLEHDDIIYSVAGKGCFVAKQKGSIEIKDLSLTFKNADEDHEALKAVTLDIPEGCIYGFVGSNGAGKSTLLRVISGIYRPDSGSVTIDETEVYDRPQAKENIFFVSDETVQFSRLTVNDLKSFYQSSYPTFDDKVFDDLISKLDLPRKKPLSQFSKGMKRQAIVAAALASRTKYILLDEAFDGLDPAMRRLIRTMIVDDIFDRGATLIVSSHNVTEIGELCDKAMLLHKGEVIFAKDIDDVREGFEKVQIALPDGELDRTVIENAGVEVLSFKTLGRVSTVITKGDKADITAKLSALSPAVLELVPLTLEEIFIYEMEVHGYANSEE